MVNRGAQTGRAFSQASEHDHNLSAYFQKHKKYSTAGQQWQDLKLTVIFRLAYSRATDLVNPMTPALAAA
jgi:hypothetical protein